MRKIIRQTTTRARRETTYNSDIVGGSFSLTLASRPGRGSENSESFSKANRPASRLAQQPNITIGRRPTWKRSSRRLMCSTCGRVRLFSSFVFFINIQAVFTIWDTSRKVLTSYSTDRTGHVTITGLLQLYKKWRLLLGGHYGSRKSLSRNRRGKHYLSHKKPPA